MRAISIEPFGKVDLKDALVVVAFPTTGSAAPIAAHYLVRHLKLPLVGHIRSPDLEGVTAISDGVATSAVRVYGGEVACRLDMHCPRVFVVLTELALPSGSVAGLADAILDWAAAGRAHLVLALEAVVRNEGDTTPDVFSASSDATVLRELTKSGTPAMERALIGGMTSHLLLASARRQARAGSLLVEASRDHPDGRAAAALLEAFARIAPDVAMDHRPLLEEALQLEEDVRRAQSSAQLPPSVSTPQFI